MAARSTLDAIADLPGKHAHSRQAPSPATGAPVEYDGRNVQDSELALVGAGRGLRAVVARIEQVAPTDAPVLLEGETGSGKELVARLLHARSRRASGPLIRVNCGAIPASLIDSELFGHERGSFTGASATRHGWFERANGGTLFLDEVAELSLAAQVRLLRVLSEGTFERVGGGRVISVDVRVVTATHRDLRTMCASGAFRDDLFYRIGVFTVRIPPLRECREDIPELVAHFARRSGERIVGVPIAPSAAEIEALLAYAWPGNVRELAAVVERAAILGGGRRLEVAAALGDDAPSVTSTFPTLADATRAHIERALVHAHGRIEGAGGAADLLGVNPHTLRGKMRKLRIDWSRFR